MRVEIAGSNVSHLPDNRPAAARAAPAAARAVPEPHSGQYLAPFKQAIQALGLKSEIPERFEITREQFLAFLRVMLRGVPFDERYYLSTNPDIRDSIARGEAPSARTHFIDHGYTEGRDPSYVRIDEHWYLATYPDIAEGLELGEIASCQEHFDGHGRDEGRMPFKI